MAALENGQVIRCAVIGYGGAFNMGKGHLNWMNAAPGLQGVAACDLDPARMEAAKADFPDIQTYTSVEELLANPEIDLVTLITPHNTHAPLAIQCSEAGKHVITEKPMCITLDEADAMIAAGRKAGKMVSVFHNRRWDGDHLALEEVIDKGLIGEVFRIEANAGGWGHPGHWWRSVKEISGGHFYDWGAHFLYWMLNLVKDKKLATVDGYFQKRVWMDVTNEDEVQALIRFDDGAVGAIQMSSIAKVGLPRWRILGTKGAIEDHGGGKFKLVTEVDGMKAEAEVQYKETDWAAYYRNIAEHLLHGAPLEVTAEKARRVIQIIDLAERSSNERRTMECPYP
jgi:scyllo-inositol 2-dehydrogenase (NADP+)